MISKWNSHIKDPHKKEEFKNFVKGSKPVLDRLIELLDKELELSLKEQRKIDIYETPNWEYIQVDHNATQRTLQKIKDICNV